MEILQYDFMKIAFIIGIVIALVCSSIGVFLVLKRFSMIGDTLSHISLSGVAIGMVVGIYPIYSAIIVSVVSAIGIEKLRKSYKEYSELVLSIFLAGGIGIASIIINMFSGKTTGIMSYLFGSIVLVSRTDMYLTILFGIAILLSMVFLYRKLFFIIFDEEGAKISGINTETVNEVFSVIVALTVTISMRIVGVLLVSSLIVLPVATSIQISRSFKQTILYSNIFSSISVVLGLLFSYYLDLSPGGTIVLISLFILILVLILKKIKK